MAEIAVAGATGNLGGKIVEALLRQGGEVRALVRPRTKAEKRTKLERPGVQIVEADFADADALAGAVEGAGCVVSVLSGLRETIVGVQSNLLRATEAAGVKRFIPSDFSVDFSKLPDGENRNLDLRREFHRTLDVSSVAATSILNGAFMDMLLGGMPLLDIKAKRVSYWESADVPLDFTAMDDMAAFTALAALDDSTPTTVRIAGDTVTARELADLTGSELVRMGSLDELASRIQQERAKDPASEKELYPRWQGMQYLHSMFSGRGRLEPLDNGRYPELRWTRVGDLIGSAGK